MVKMSSAPVLIHFPSQVTIEEESLLAHPTRDRAKIPLGRRLPTRGHLMAVVGGILALTLIPKTVVVCLLIRTSWHSVVVWCNNDETYMQLFIT